MIEAKNKQDIVLAVNMLSFKKTYVIIAKTKLDTGLSSNASQTNCELNWNQAIILPTKKNKTPM